MIRKLSDDLDWTTDLGDAIVSQPQDVANAIQLLRAKAEEAGTLKTTNEQVVTTQKQDDRDVVIIESADPSVIYVPSYDPVAVYNPLPAYGTRALVAGLLTFGAAVAIGSAWRGSYWNWATGAFYPPVWPGYPAWRPPYPGWRPGMPIGGGGNIGIGDRPWRPDIGRYRPGGRPTRCRRRCRWPAGARRRGWRQAGCRRRYWLASRPGRRGWRPARSWGWCQQTGRPPEASGAACDSTQRGPGHGGLRRDPQRGLGRDLQPDL